MKKSQGDIKKQALEVFKRYPKIEFNITDFTKEYVKMHGWQPHTLDVHIRQMHEKLGIIDRPHRGIYSYTPGVVEEVILPEPSGQFNIFHLL
jgi:hypothetical protein